jgi:hypothetical protein
MVLFCAALLTPGCGTVESPHQEICPSGSFQRILVQPKNQDYKSARIGVFRFASLPHAPGAGYDAAKICFQQCLLSNLFYSLSPEFFYEFTDLEDQLKIAFQLRLDMIITGRLLIYEIGGEKRPFRVKGEMKVVEVPTGKIIWHLEALTTGKPRAAEGPSLQKVDEPAFLLELMSRNQMNFVNMLREFPS